MMSNSLRVDRRLRPTLVQLLDILLYHPFRALNSGTTYTDLVGALPHSNWALVERMIE